jgi:hypothetical protein
VGIQKVLDAYTSYLRVTETTREGLHCANCGKRDESVIPRQGGILLCWDCRNESAAITKDKEIHRPPLLDELFDINIEGEIGCDVCQTTKGVRKVSGEDKWLCKMHRPPTKAKLKNSCLKCGATKDIRKWPKKDKWYCQAHRPSKKAATKKICQKCQTIEGVRKVSGEDKWYCKAHWPPKEAKAKISCQACDTTEGVRKAYNKDEWYCKAHRPPRKGKHS